MLCYCLSAKRDFSSELLGPHRRRKPCSSARRSKMATSAHCATIEPAGLYPQGDGSFEFARTVSRLEEMRSAEYLAEGHGAA